VSEGERYSPLMRVIGAILEGTTSLHASTSLPPKTCQFFIHGVFLPDSRLSARFFLLLCRSPWVLESLNKIDDLTARSKNIIGG
jgi:hypothetical protein